MSCYGRSYGIDPNIRARLQAKLVPLVSEQCSEEGFCAGPERIRRHLPEAIDWFLDEFCNPIEEDDVEDEDEEGEEEEAEDDEPQDDLALIGNYYEDNWNGEIEDYCVKTIIAEMEKEGIESDPDYPFTAAKATELELEECEFEDDEDDDEE